MATGEKWCVEYKDIPIRWYMSTYGLSDVIAVELEYESVDVYEKRMAEFGASGDMAAFWQPLGEYMLHGGSTEGWTLLQ